MYFPEHDASMIYILLTLLERREGLERGGAARSSWSLAGATQELGFPLVKAPHHAL
jgi:hypothetical protein